MKTTVVTEAERWKGQEEASQNQRTDENVTRTLIILFAKRINFQKFEIYGTT